MPRTATKATVQPTGLGMISIDDLLAKLPKPTQKIILAELTKSMIPEASVDDYRAAERVMSGHPGRGDYFGYVRVAQRFIATQEGLSQVFEDFVGKHGKE